MVLRLPCCRSSQRFLAPAPCRRLEPRPLIGSSFSSTAFLRGDHDTDHHGRSRTRNERPRQLSSPFALNHNPSSDASTTTTRLIQTREFTTATLVVSASEIGAHPSVFMTKTPTFRVAKVAYHPPEDDDDSPTNNEKMGGIEYLNLDTPGLLKEAGMFPRDLLALNVTSRQERRRKRHTKPSHHQDSLTSAAAATVADSQVYQPANRRAMAAIVTRQPPNNSSRNNNQSPHRRTIIVSFGNLRAVVGLQHVYLLDAHQLLVQEFAETLARIFRERQRQLQQQNLSSSEMSSEPFELIVLEGILRDTVEAFYRRLRLYEPIVDRLLDRVQVYHDTGGVHQLGPVKESLQSFEIQAKQSVDCLADLLDQDERMLDLLLTEQEQAAQQGTTVNLDRHEDVEVLLGVYARQLSNILLEIKFLLGRLQSKQEFVALALAGYRNRMVRMNVNVSIVGMSLAVGTTMSGFFGMNLVHGFEADPYAFWAVVGGATTAGIVVTLGSWSYLSEQSLQRQAAESLQEMHTIGRALSDIQSIDYSLKSTGVQKRGRQINKDQFRASLEAARAIEVTEEEADLLFDCLDRVKDGVLGEEDFALSEYLNQESVQENNLLKSGETETTRS